MSRKWSSSTCIVSRRSSAASDARRASRTAGSSAIRTRNASRGRTAHWEATNAVAVADRGAPSRRASSPKTSPARKVAMIASSPVSDGSEIFDFAGYEDEQAVARVADVEDHLAPAESPHPHARGDSLAGGGVETREERDRRDRFRDGRTREHRRRIVPSDTGRDQPNSVPAGLGPVARAASAAAR